MNRERDLTGSNGYAKEVGFNPLDFLRGCESNPVLGGFDRRVVRWRL
jgi:hypothetical protein